MNVDPRGQAGAATIGRRWLPPCVGAVSRPAPTSSSSRSCSRANAQSKRDVETGCGFRLRPFGLTGSSARNSARENSVCCGFGAWSPWPFPLTSVTVVSHPDAGAAYDKWCGSHEQQQEAKGGRHPVALRYGVMAAEAPTESSLSSWYRHFRAIVEWGVDQRGDPVGLHTPDTSWVGDAAIGAGRRDGTEHIFSFSIG